MTAYRLSIADAKGLTVRERRNWLVMAMKRASSMLGAFDG